MGIMEKNMETTVVIMRFHLRSGASHNPDRHDRELLQTCKRHVHAAACRNFARPLCALAHSDPTWRVRGT